MNELSKRIKYALWKLHGAGIEECWDIWQESGGKIEINWNKENWDSSDMQRTRVNSNLTTFDLVL